MNKGVKFLFCGIFILISLFMVFVLFENFSAVETSGNAIWNLTGKSTTQVTDVAIGILPPPAPILILTDPKNQTYFVKEAIPLNYSVSGADALWYSLDSGANLTINSSGYFNASNGNHNLILYANNSLGIGAMSSANVSFTVNSSLFRIIDVNYTGATKGNSTNFTIYSYNEIQNLTNVILENINYGKISFNANINLTNGLNKSEINLDDNIIISLNQIWINSTQLSNLNQPATLSLYGLSFSNATILRNGVVCPADICTEINYSGQQSYYGGTLIFNVTDMSGIYSAEETPGTPVIITVGGVSSSGGGGGGITTKIIPDEFSVNRDEIKVSLVQGLVTTEKIIVHNNLNQKISIQLSETGLDQFVVLGDSQITLNSKETREIPIDIMVRETAAPYLYVGKIILDDGQTRKEVLVVVEVQSRGALFDVSVNIPSTYLRVSPNQELISEIKLYNLGTLEKEVDTQMSYEIKSEETGNTIFVENETLAVETQASFIKEVKIPKDAPTGKYLLYVRSIYAGKTASASAEFTIVESIEKQLYIIATLLFLIIFILIIYLIKRRKGPEKRISSRNLVRR